MVYHHKESHPTLMVFFLYKAYAPNKQLLQHHLENVISSWQHENQNTTNLKALLRGDQIK
jgi:hypothetical protein